jgi:hypothetical protein
MKLLNTEFIHDGRTLKQLARTDKIAIYQLVGYQGLGYGFEVIKIRVKKQTEAFKKVLREREVYPASSQFGYMAWSFGRNQKSQAFERYGTFVQREHQSLHANGPRAFQRDSGKEEAAANP